MRLHETLAQFSDVVSRYEVMQYDVEKRCIELIERYAGTEGLTISEAFNRAFQRFCEGK